MDVMNLAHGSLFMTGAYVASQAHVNSGSFVAAVVIAIVVTILAALLLEVLLIVIALWAPQGVSALLSFARRRVA